MRRATFRTAKRRSCGTSSGSGSPGTRGRCGRASAPNAIARRRLRSVTVRGSHAAARGRFADLSPRFGRRRHRLRDHARRPRQRPPPQRAAPSAAVRGARRDAAGVRAPRLDPRPGRTEARQAGSGRDRRVAAGRGDSGRGGAGATSRSSGCRATTSISTSHACAGSRPRRSPALSDEELAARVGVPVSVSPVLRGARDLAEARAYAELVLEPPEVEVDSPETLARFRELVERGLEPTSGRPGAEGGRRRPESAPPGLTGRDRGPELAAVIAALPRDELLRRAT